MAKKGTSAKPPKPDVSTPPARGRPSALLDTRVVYCGDCLEQLRSLPAACVDLVYIDPPFNSNRNYEGFWGETKEKWAFEDRQAKAEPATPILVHPQGPVLRFPLTSQRG
jgi:hypothetical protein